MSTFEKLVLQGLWIIIMRMIAESSKQTIPWERDYLQTMRGWW